jgi:hypothetical protein
MISTPFSPTPALSTTTAGVGRHTSGKASATRPPAVEELISQSRGMDGWNYLGNETRRWLGGLEPQLPQSFWVHRDSASRRAARMVGAAGFSRGNRIFLGECPAERLEMVLRHELVHLAQVQVALQTSIVAPLDAIEYEAEVIGGLPVALPVRCGADPNRIHPILWFVALGVGLYVLLRPGTANAPGPEDTPVRSPSVGQIISEAICLFVVPGGAIGIGGRLGLGFLGRSALAGAATTTSLRITGDVAQGSPSSPLMYIFDIVTGAAIGWVVPGGVRLIGRAGTYAFDRLDALAAVGFTKAALALSRTLADAVEKTPMTAEQVQQFLRSRGLAGQVTSWWLNLRHQVILFRGQQIATTSIESPMARWEGVTASQELLARLRAAGLDDVEIASFAARYHIEPIRRFEAPPDMAGQRLGSVGIPTTTIPGIAARFAGDRGVVYVIRVPRNLVVRPIPWPHLVAEDEHVIFNQIPAGSVVQVIPADEVPPLLVNGDGLLVPAK